MTASSFNRHLIKRLCWIDGSPTHVSSARQRQCARCRRKWSYEAMSKRWLLAQEFCTGHNRREAAQATGVGVHTVGRHYDAFERVLAGHLRRNLRQGRTEVLAAGAASLRVDAKRPRSPKQTQRLAARFCFEGLSIRRRVQLIYQLAFAARVERLLCHKPPSARLPPAL